MAATAFITPQQALDMGYMPIPLRNNGSANARKAPARENWQRRTFAASEWKAGEGVGLRLGRQQDGSYAYCLDLDSHNDMQDAEHFLHTALNALPPDLSARLFLARSTGGKGRYAMFRSTLVLTNGLLFDHEGNHAGECLGVGRHVVCPTSDRWLNGTLVTLPMLTDGETTAILAAFGYRPSKQTNATLCHVEIDDAEVAYWLGKLNKNGPVLDANGVPRRFTNPKGKARRILTGEYRVTDESIARKDVIYGMVMHGYPDALITAFALTFCNKGKTAGRGWRSLIGDILRLIVKAHAEMPTAKAMPVQYRGIWYGRGSAATNSQPVKRAVGRPKTDILEIRYRWLLENNDCGVNTDTNVELATAWGCSERTVRRTLDQLEQEGRIRRSNLLGQRTVELVALRKVATNSLPVECEEQVFSITQTQSVELAPIGETPYGPQASNAPGVPPEPTDLAVQPVLEQHQPQPTLLEAVEDALNAYKGYHKSNRADAIVYHVHANYPGLATDDAIRVEYKGQMERNRNWLFTCDLTQLRPHELRQIRAAGRFMAWQGTKHGRQKQINAGKYVQDRVEGEFNRRGDVARRQAGQSQTVRQNHAIEQRHDRAQGERAAHQPALFVLDPPSTPYQTLFNDVAHIHPPRSCATKQQMSKNGKEHAISEGKEELTNAYGAVETMDAQPQMTEPVKVVQPWRYRQNVKRMSHQTVEAKANEALQQLPQGDRRECNGRMGGTTVGTATRRTG